MDESDALIASLLDRVERLERREAEMSEWWRDLVALHDAETELDENRDRQFRLVANMLLGHLGLPELDAR